VTDEQQNPEDDLRTRLHAMETKLRRMKEQRNSFNEDARRAADSRNALQEQSKGIRESIKEKLDEQKKVRDQAQVCKAKRDEIQNQIRELINQNKGKRGDAKESKSVVFQLSEIINEIEKIENTMMTDGRLILETENKLLKKLKVLITKRNKLMPAMEEFELINIDIGDMDGSIRLLKSEADKAHQEMIDFHKQADAIWEDIKPMLSERDFLRAEADRLHAAYVTCRESANEVHANMSELISQVNEIRDEMKAAEEERLKVIKDHNQSVKDALKKPSEDEDMANSLASQLLDSGSLTLGGVLGTDSSSVIIKSTRGKKQSRKLGTTRGKK
jgi:uncharacterized coiled-coil DUF342 family protein|tara:strand:- start:3204 stop:4193 length:990 start_codon:yes stop_codon:yes gene_type:complete